MRKRYLVLLAFVVLLAPPVLAQRFTASIRGTVTIEEGTKIPGANVTVTNQETGLTQSRATNEVGNFSFGELPVGVYDLRVELDSFKTAVVEAITLNVADVREVNVSLELGAVEEELTVTSQTILVETVGGEVSSVITGKEVRELPLNGRNFTQLSQLMPGVSTPDGTDYKNKGLLTGVDTSVSGSMATGNNWMVDGASNNDVGSNRTILIYPSVEAIEEFKIHRNSYGPEFGGAGGAQINLVTKSGTNQYHGSAFVFYRDDSFNEKNFFLKESGGEKDELDRKDFGFTLGGPIVRDKVHFFVSGEWNDETRGTVRAAVVPTAAERAGDFSQTVPGCSAPVPVDPLTGQPFPGNVIPSDQLSPGGAALLDLYPQPNATPTSDNCSNWVGSVPTDVDWQQLNARLDWTVNDSSRVLLRYTNDSWENPGPNAGENNGLWGDDPFPAVDSGWDQPGESLVVQLNQVFGASAVNTFTFSMSGNEIDITRSDDGGLNSEINALVPTFFPEEQKTGGAERSHPVYWGGATGNDLWNIAPWSNDLDIMVLKDDYQQVFGDHWVKAGVLYSESSKVESCCGSNAFESPHFWGGTGVGGWGATSGNRIADILIDNMYHGYDESAFQPAPELEWEDLEIYVGDSWKIRPNLTLDYGVRYTRHEAPYAKDDNIAAFYPSLWDPALGEDACNGVAQVPGTDPCGAAGLLGGGEGVSRSFVEDDTDNFAPRLGLAWDVFGSGKSVVRAGFGQYFQRERVNIQLDFGGQPPFTQNTFGIRPLDFADPTFLGQGFGVPNRGINSDNETPYNLQFNLTWEQRIPWQDSSIEISYVGNRGRHLAQKYDVNQVPSADLNGNGVSDRLDFLRGGGDGDGSVRPFFTGGGNRILYWDNIGSSEYDGLQTQFQARFGRGSVVQASYTFSSFEADTDVLSSSAGEEEYQLTDLENPGLDWGKTRLHRDHVFNSSVVWNLPAFEGQGGFKEHVLGDWSIGGVVAYASGTPITVFAADIPGLPQGGFAGTGYDDNNRPIRVPGVSCSGGGGVQVINPAAFTLDGLRLGETSQMAKRGSCEGPDFFQIDLAFYKNLRFGDRFEGQFRIEIFNLTDETNFVADSVENFIRPTNVVFDAPDVADATEIVSADIPGNFGQASAVRDPRQIQLAFKLSF